MDGRMLKALWGLWLLAALLPAQAQEVYYIHTDALGSPVAETDTSRNVVARFEYEPYGRRLNASNDDKPGYTGHVMDAVTGLVQMQQRYYDPGIGRFLSRDPVTADPNTGTNFNGYWYGNNNPYRFTDPDGRLACTGGNRSECQEKIREMEQRGVFLLQAKSGSGSKHRNSDPEGDEIRETRAGFFREAGETYKEAGIFIAEFAAVNFVGGPVMRLFGKVGRYFGIGGRESSWVLSAGKSEAKWASQMKRRGWTSGQISEAVSRGKGFPAENLVTMEIQRLDMCILKQDVRS